METKHGEARARIFADTNTPQINIEDYRLPPTKGLCVPEIPQAGGVKHDQGKPRYDLLPPEALAGLADILGYGAAKYAPHNWRKGMDWSRVFAAAQRHVWAFWTGEDLDPESGLPHIDHAMCCLAFLSAYQKAGLGTDDRNNLLESLRAR